MIVPFVPMHLEGFEIQDKQKSFADLFNDPVYVDDVFRYGNAYTGIHEGEVMVIAGVMPLYRHIGLAWALIGKNANRHLLRATRAFKANLDTLPYPRIEMHVRRDFEQAHRWAKMLGFENETPGAGMRNFGVDGETCDLYARCKEWPQ